MCLQGEIVVVCTIWMLFAGRDRYDTTDPTEELESTLSYASGVCADVVDTIIEMSPAGYPRPTGTPQFWERIPRHRALFFLQGEIVMVCTIWVMFSLCLSLFPKCVMRRKCRPVPDGCLEVFTIFCVGAAQGVTGGARNSHLMMLSLFCSPFLQALTWTLLLRRDISLHVQLILAVYLQPCFVKAGPSLYKFNHFVDSGPRCIFFQCF